MPKKLLVYMLGYLVCEISLFLLLTLALPSTAFSEPKWTGIGCFAEYNVEDGTLMNGTYAWSIVDVKESSAGRIVTINETFVGTSHWDHVAVWDNQHQNFSNIIPSNGRILDVNAGEGSAAGLVLWLTKYCNQFLPSLSILGSEGTTWLGGSEGKMPFQGGFRDFVQFTQAPHILSGSDFSREAKYDKTTGLLLAYRWSWPHLGSVIVSLESTNVFDLGVNYQGNGVNMILDIIVVALLFAFPLALASLLLMRQGNEISSLRFLLILALSNGIFLGLFIGWSIGIWITYCLPALGISAFADIGLWIAILGALTANMLTIGRLTLTRSS
jgi:hypothetical protein